MSFDVAPVEVGSSRWSLPDATSWPVDDIVATGADLEPSTLIDAYRHGFFPMHVGDDDILAWWSPVLRGIIELDSLRITRSMRRSAKRYRCTIDESFDDVIAACAEVPRGGNWINDDMVSAYRTLHRLGWAHSVETWLDDELVGGLYGVRIDRFFAGESMFHTRTDASKVALMHLVDTMRRENMMLLDVQWVTPHLSTLGAMEIPRDAYLRRLSSAIDPIV